MIRAINLSSPRLLGLINLLVSFVFKHIVRLSLGFVNKSVYMRPISGYTMEFIFEQ